MESQMFGTPVLASNIGGIPELLQSGVTGELFTPGNKPELRKKIEKLLSSPELIEKYRNNCRDIQFDDVEQYYSKIMKIYKG